MPYQFSLPSINDLSRDQRIALLANMEEVFIISGCPGSGKTTVALLRARNKGADPKSHYTVWANLLYGYLLNIAPLLKVSEGHFSTFYSWFYWNYGRPNGVQGFNQEGPNIEGIKRCLNNASIKYDEFQLDEGQDLPLEIRCGLAGITKKLVICMDPAQDVQGVGRAYEDEAILHTPIPIII